MHTDQPGKPESAQEKHGRNRLLAIPESADIAYNLREGERPDGLKVWFKITIAGQEARELDARQAEAIWRLLQWAQHNQHSPDQT
ncbi:MAG: hypothetical protein JO016_18470 [Actinobacteria bacterium]|nr:hypothetical protein [Actinomycetota bacterium]